MQCIPALHVHFSYELKCDVLDIFVCMCNKIPCIIATIQLMQYIHPSFHPLMHTAICASLFQTQKTPCNRSIIRSLVHPLIRTHSVRTYHVQTCRLRNANAMLSVCEEESKTTITHWVRKKEEKNGPIKRGIHEPEKKQDGRTDGKD